MKKAFFFFTGVVLTLVFTWIYKKYDSNKPTGPDTAFFALPLSTAKSYIHKYRQYDSAFKQYDAIVRKCDSAAWAPYSKVRENMPRHFTVRATDLIEALGFSKDQMGIMKHHHVRVYLGLDDSAQFHLLFTPVIGAELLCTETPNLGKDEMWTGSMHAPNCAAPYGKGRT
ncbi:MAG TPA: hypothetical protein VKQ08_08180, partial [Cyclobacteriaceae bacterium]|nr:hypothetical protein [Cyclobacteriaceae bacterium]